MKNRAISCQVLKGEVAAHRARHAAALVHRPEEAMRADAGDQRVRLGAPTSARCRLYLGCTSAVSRRDVSSISAEISSLGAPHASHYISARSRRDLGAPHRVPLYLGEIEVSARRIASQPFWKSSGVMSGEVAWGRAERVSGGTGGGGGGGGGSTVEVRMGTRMSVEVVMNDKSSQK